MALLGIDVGTSALKAALYSTAGEALALAAHEYPAAAGNGGLHPQQLWETLRAAVRQVTHTAGAPVRAVAISSHGESFVPVDEKGEALSGFVLNTDACATAEAEDFARAFGKERLFAITGLPPHWMYTLPKIVWLRTHRPDIFARARRFLCVEDYLLARAGVGCHISTSLACRTLGFDLTAGAWSAPLLAHAGLPAEALSTPVAAGTPLGRAAREVAKDLHLPADALWVAGGHDQACCSLGSGGLAAGVGVDGNGTFESLSVVTERPLLSTAALRCNLPAEVHAVPGLFLTIGFVWGGLGLRWFRDTLSRACVEQAAATHANAYDLMLSGLPEAPTKLLVFPHLIGTGTPWLDPKARAAIFGFDVTTTYADIAKAVLEGITLEMQWNLQLLQRMGIRPHRIHAVGGGARSPAWLQLKADVFGEEVVAVPGEATCAGAAMCAGVGAGVFADFRQAAEAFVRPGRPYRPRAEQHARYGEKLAEYQELAGRVYGFRSPEA